MKRSKITFIILLFINFFLGLDCEISNSRANPLAVYSTELGGFIPKDNYSCSMPNASVLIEIYNPKPYDPFDLEFMGNYTLYNPDNTLNLTIAAPFSSNLLGQNSSCTIKLNGTIIPYEIIEYQWNETSSWDPYIHVYNRNLIICNITVPMNETVILEYLIKTYVEPPSVKIDLLHFDYDIATAAAWNGSITEIIEFRVHGQQPDSYYPTYHSPRIIDIYDGKRYIWEFWGVIFDPYYDWPIGISYRIENNYISLGNYYLTFFLLGIISVMLYQRMGKRGKF